MLDDYISEYFYENSMIVAIMLILYGIAFLFSGKLNEGKKSMITLSEVTYKAALVVGFFQCLAMIPGTSRSGATIIGGLLIGMSKSVVAEFSFFLAIPTMFGATLLKLVKNGVAFSNSEWVLMIFGSFVAFVVSLMSIKWLMGYIKKRDFKVFGVYRIVIGIVVILMLSLF
jgi:undecaprenyl-diphosphatase